MKIFFYTYFIFVLMTPEVICQSTRHIEGRIINQETNLPVKNITVYSDFDQDITDNSGLYNLDLSKCRDCAVGKRIFVSTYSEEYGFFQTHFGLTSDLKADIRIPRNPNLTGVMGIVKDLRTKRTITGVKVRIGVDGDPNVKDEIKTDSFGMYRFLLRRDKVGNIKYITIFFEDENGRYLSKHETKNIATFIDSFLEPNETPPVEIEIEGYKKTQVKVLPGNLIRIKSSGNVRLGPHVGSTDPDGLASGVAGFSLESYNINRSIRHGALMYRVSGDQEWKLSGKEVEFTTQQGGYLEFQINDNDQGNNSGAYKTRVIVTK